MTNGDDILLELSGTGVDTEVLNISDKTNGHKYDFMQKPNVTKCTTMEILRRHPMYDCLVLVKKYHKNLNYYVLDFPDDELLWQDCAEEVPKCPGMRIIRSKVVDRLGVDWAPKTRLSTSSESSTDEQIEPIDSIVHVPINGLIDRLKTYTMNGTVVDSKVFSFAMGLKTGERLLTTSAMHEIQEQTVPSM